MESGDELERDLKLNPQRCWTDGERRREEEENKNSLLMTPARRRRAAAADNLLQIDDGRAFLSSL